MWWPQNTGLVMRWNCILVLELVSEWPWKNEWFFLYLCPQSGIFLVTMEVEKKTDRQNQQPHPKCILPLICFCLSPQIQSLTSLKTPLSVCRFLSLICKWQPTHRDRIPGGTSLRPLTQHQPLENVQEILSVLLMTFSWLYIMVWTSSPFSRRLLLWLSNICSPLALCCSPDPSWPSHPQLCNILTHEDGAISVLHTIFFLFVLVLT